MSDGPAMSTGMAICLTLCVAIMFFHLGAGSAALNYHGAENYESLWFLLVGVPLFIVEIILSIALFVGLLRQRRWWAFAAQLPLAVSAVIVVAVLGPSV